MLPISLCGILDLSRVLFATMLGVIVLGEKITLYKTIGLILVSSGLLFLKFNPVVKKENHPVIKSNSAESETKNSSAFFIILAFVSCLLNAVSGLLDKILMKEMNSSQLQFWYTLFLTSYYILYAFIGKIKIIEAVTFLYKSIF